MAYSTQLSDAAANAACAAVTALAPSGSLRIYTGTQPANANNAVPAGGDGTHVLLVTLPLHATNAFASPSAGAAIAGGTGYEITAANAVATGTATWFRILKSDASTIVFEGSVGTSGCNLNLNSASISSGASVGVTSLTFSILEANTAG
jgi:hypothetical protein